MESIDENSAPIVRLVQLMITEAVQLRASDIHVEPFEEVVGLGGGDDLVVEAADLTDFEDFDGGLFGFGRSWIIWKPFYFWVARGGAINETES